LIDAKLVVVVDFAWSKYVVKLLCWFLLKWVKKKLLLLFVDEIVELCLEWCCVMLFDCWRCFITC